MKAFILAAGLGTRLRPLTDNKPKALVEVNGKTLLEHAIETVVKAGATSVVVNIHHFADLMKEFISKLNVGVPIYISDESDKLLDTGGAIHFAESLLAGNEPILVHNVDIFSTIDINEVVKKHIQSNAVATLICNSRNSTRHLLSIDGRLRAWENTATGERKPDFSDDERKIMQTHSFAGIHIIAPCIFTSLSRFAEKKGDKFSVIDFYLDLCKEEKVSIYNTCEKVFDCGKVETISQISSFLSER